MDGQIFQITVQDFIDIKEGIAKLTGLVEGLYSFKSRVETLEKAALTESGHEKICLSNWNLRILEMKNIENEFVKKKELNQLVKKAFEEYENERSIKASNKINPYALIFGIILGILGFIFTILTAWRK